MGRCTAWRKTSRRYSNTDLAVACALQVFKLCLYPLNMGLGSKYSINRSKSLKSVSAASLGPCYNGLSALSTTVAVTVEAECNLTL